MCPCPPNWSSIRRVRSRIIGAGAYNQQGSKFPCKATCEIGNRRLGCDIRGQTGRVAGRQQGKRSYRRLDDEDNCLVQRTLVTVRDGVGQRIGSEEDELGAL